MAIYVPLQSTPLQYVDANGDPLASGTLEFYVAGTSTPANLYSDSSGTSVGTSITLNSSGYPESGGNVITLFRDTAVNYKIIGKNSGGSTVWTSDGINSVLAAIASISTGYGASLVGVEDSAGNFSGADVEAVLAEIQASIDAIPSVAATTTGSFTATLTGCTTSPTVTMYYSVVDGRSVRLWVTSALVGTTNSTACTITGLPSAVQTSLDVFKPCIVRDAVTYALGAAEINSSTPGTIVLYTNSASAPAIYNSNSFANGGGSKGINDNWSIEYEKV